MPLHNHLLRDRARQLRKQMTDAERALWQRLRRKQICGLRFYRQTPLLSFIVDFYCPAAGLVVEVDGGQHYGEEHQASDRRRDAALSALGLRVLRFHNRQVLCETEGVVGAILVAVEAAERESPPAPL